MSAHATPTTPENDPGNPAADGVAEYYTRVLHELINVGVELARTLPAQARAQAAAQEHAQTHAHTHAQPGAAPAAPGRDEPNDDTAPAPTDVALAYDRITRAVRRTVLLARKLAEPAPAPGDATVAAAQAATRRRVAARRQIIREVEDAIGQAARNSAAAAARAETLHAELLDRLDGPDLEDDINHRPAAEIVADICRDLGIAAAYGANPWRRRTPTDIEILCARAAAPAAARPTQAAQPVNGPKPPNNPRPPRATPPAAAVPSAPNPTRPDRTPAATPDRPRAPRDPAHLRTDPAARPTPAASTGAGLDPPPHRGPPGPPATILPYAARPPDP